MVSSRSSLRLLVGCLIVGLLIAGACSDSEESQVATLTDTRPPPPVETVEAAPSEPPAAESPPAEEPSGEPPAAAPRPADTAAPPEPPPEPSSAPVPTGDLDAAAIGAVVAAADAAQPGVTSSSEQLYLTMEVSLGGQSMGSLSEIPYALSTTAGGLTHILIDQSALAALSALEDGFGPAPTGDMPPIEAILDGNTEQMYIKLGPLAALGPGERPPFLDDLNAQGHDLANLWGRPVFEGQRQEILPGFGLGARPAIGEFIGLLKAASDTGSVLEARSVGPSQTAGVATQEYRIVVDLGALIGHWPPFLQGFLAGPGGGEPPPPELLNSLPAGLASEFTLHVDGGGLAREVGFDLDLGALLMAAFAGFGDMGGAPEGAEVDFPEIGYRLAMRVEALSVNDPSTAVALPDPSQVVDVPFP